MLETRVIQPDIQLYESIVFQAVQGATTHFFWVYQNIFYEGCQGEQFSEAQLSFLCSFLVLPFQYRPLGNFGNSLASVSFISPNVHKAYSIRLLVHSRISTAAEEGGKR